MDDSIAPPKQSKPRAKAPAAVPAVVSVDTAPAAELPPPPIAATDPVTTIESTEETIMDTTTTTAADTAATFKSGITEMQTKAQAGYEKAAASLGDANDFAKGNVEAMVESSKILAAGLQEMGSAFVADSRSAFETMTADVKELAAVKSPTDFIRLQSEMVRKAFDGAVAYSSKHTEAMLKLANEAAAPLSNRVNLAVEKIKTTA